MALDTTSLTSQGDEPSWECISQRFYDVTSRDVRIPFSLVRNDKLGIKRFLSFLCLMKVIYRYNDARTRHQLMFCKFQTAKGLKNCLKFKSSLNWFHALSRLNEVYLLLYDENPCNFLINAERLDILSSGYKCTLTWGYDELSSLCRCRFQPLYHGKAVIRPILG